MLRATLSQSASAPLPGHWHDRFKPRNRKLYSRRRHRARGLTTLHFLAMILGNIRTMVIITGLWALDIDCRAEDSDHLLAERCVRPVKADWVHCGQVLMPWHQHDQEWWWSRPLVLGTSLFIRLDDDFFSHPEVSAGIFMRGLGCSCMPHTHTSPFPSSTLTRSELQGSSGKNPLPEGRPVTAVHCTAP